MMDMLIAGAVAAFTSVASEIKPGKKEGEAS